VTDADIIDRIDELVDEQLSGGEPRTGYNYGDPTYPRCWHCGRHWHGLPITQRIADMYALGEYDETYSLDRDNTEVICPGSDFIGPMPAPRGAHTPVTAALLRHGDVVFRMVIDTEAMQENMRRWREQAEAMTRSLMAMARIEWTLPADTFDPSPWFQTITFRSADARLIYPRWVMYEGRPTLPTPSAHADPPPIDVQFGKQWWRCEMQHVPGTCWMRAGLWLPGDPVAPLPAAVRDHWAEFTAPNYPTPERPGFDFTAWAVDDQRHGPSSPRSANPDRRTSTATRQHQRRGRRTR
jgi:hypothetical protein